MNIKLKVKTNGDTLEIKMSNILTLKKASLKACYNEFDVLIISNNDSTVVYPVKNILKIEIYKI